MITLQEVRSEEFDEKYNLTQLMSPESLSVRQRHFFHNGTTRIRYTRQSPVHETVTFRVFKTVNTVNVRLFKTVAYKIVKVGLFQTVTPLPPQRHHPHPVLRPQVNIRQSRPDYLRQSRSDYI